MATVATVSATGFTTFVPRLGPTSGVGVWRTGSATFWTVWRVASTVCVTVLFSWPTVAVVLSTTPFTWASV